MARADCRSARTDALAPPRSVAPASDDVEVLTNPNTTIEKSSFTIYKSLLRRKCLPRDGMHHLKVSTDADSLHWGWEMVGGTLVPYLLQYRGPAGHKKHTGCGGGVAGGDGPTVAAGGTTPAANGRPRNGKPTPVPQYRYAFSHRPCAE
eukprot:7150925-Prymnesium_polylepis.1